MGLIFQRKIGWPIFEIVRIGVLARGRGAEAVARGGFQRGWPNGQNGKFFPKVFWAFLKTVVFCSLSGAKSRENAFFDFLGESFEKKVVRAGIWPAVYKRLRKQRGSWPKLTSVIFTESGQQKPVRFKILRWPLVRA